MRNYLLLLFFAITLMASYGQPVPAVDENIPYLQTFGKETSKEWGDDDFTQIIFFSVPKDYSKPIYIRVYDPDCGGEIDEIHGPWDTKTTFSVYGGKGACSEDARKVKLVGNYKSGNLLNTKVFTENSKMDKQWFTFGPFNPSEGEFLPEYGGCVFKIMIEGTAGDDGNLYRLFLSTSASANQPVEGANAFYFKYKFRMHEDQNEVSHIYPYIDDKVITLRQGNFDWDYDGTIRIISVAKNGEVMKTSLNNDWATSQHRVVEAEKNTSYDIQLIKNKSEKIKNNNVVIYLQNQYGTALPFYSIPIGGIPKYKYTISIKPKK